MFLRRVICGKFFIHRLKMNVSCSCCALLLINSCANVLMLSSVMESVVIKHGGSSSICSVSLLVYLNEQGALIKTN